METIHPFRWSPLNWIMEQPTSGELLSEHTELAETIVFEVADRSGREPTELPSLYRAIDTDALEALLRSEGSWCVSFEYADHEVVVTETGRVTIHELRPDVSEEHRCSSCSTLADSKV